MSENTQPSNSAPAVKGKSALRHHFGESFKFFAFVVGGLSFFAWMLFPSISTPPEVAFRTRCKNNLQQIGLALHNYHDAYGCFPPAYIADEQGRAMHSWRVLIVPFIPDSQSLSFGYRYDEPWDGPNNRKLHDVPIPIFNCPTEMKTVKSEKSVSTNYVAVIGPDTMWPGSKPVRISDITDGTSNTLMVVEIINSGIHWMEPRDLHVLKMAPTINSVSGQGMSSKHHAGAFGLFADSSVRFLSENLPVDTLRALLTRRGGEKLGDF